MSDGNAITYTESYAAAVGDTSATDGADGADASAN